MVIVNFQALLQVKEELQKELTREPTEDEIANATNMRISQVKKEIEAGRAARNKLIKVIQCVQFFYSLPQHFLKYEPCNMFSFALSCCVLS